MKQFDANQSNGSPLCCIVCGREIPGGNWFARIRSLSGRVACCGPRCVERYADDPAHFIRLDGDGSNGESEEHSAARARLEPDERNVVSFETTFRTA